jgi:tRNA dimethylallyltransferase
MMTTPTLVSIVGPTAIGKTDLSVRLAKYFQTVILSLDSRQLFKELSIGTAKPSKEEMQGIPHYFVDSHSIQEPMNAGIFERQALDLLTDLFKKHSLIIACGGTGLYEKALLEGLDELPETDLDFRLALQQTFDEKPLSYWQNYLKEIDPATYHKVDLQNPVRVFRAVEVFRQTGKPYSSFLAKEKSPRNFNVIKIALERPREELYQRIDLRMEQMLAAGLENEVKNMLPYQHLNALHTVGYTEVFDFFKGLYDREEMIRLLKRNSRHYAKRQLTWFKKDPTRKWFHPNDYQGILAYIEQQLQNPEYNRTT